MRSLKFGLKALEARNGRLCQETGELTGKATPTLMANLSLSKFNSAMEESKQLSTSFLPIGGLVRASRATSSSNHISKNNVITGLMVFFSSLSYTFLSFVFTFFVFSIASSSSAISFLFLALS